MATKLYVGGLSYSTTQDGLKDYFSQAGAVATAIIINDKMSGRSKGFGFVEMSSDEEAQKAIEMFDGKEFEGRTLTVNEARPMEERPRTGGFQRREFHFHYIQFHGGSGFNQQRLAMRSKSGL